MITNDVQFADVAEAVEEGFSQTPKRLPSWLFYDETGDKIFQAIMQMPEYYLTNCEYSIFKNYKEALRQKFFKDGSPFNLVELGAGDGLKTEILLTHFNAEELEFKYSPIDVSETVLLQLQDRLKQSIPELSIEPINSRYMEAIESLADDDLRKVYLFLGANIGNFSVGGATQFLSSIAEKMNDDDLLLTGFDLKKDPRVILAAYDDPHGITSDFNLNLLTRLNRELGADFKLDQFSHNPFYDPSTGTTKSYLVSLADQDVYLEACDKVVQFDQWEVIHTEVSQKYDIKMIEKMASDAGFSIVDIFYDDRRYFCDVLFSPL